MSIKFDYPSWSRAPFAGEWRFSKSRGLSASGSFVPLPHPPLSIFSSHPIFCAGKTPKILFLSLSLLPNPTEMLATQAMKVVYMSICLSVCLFNDSVLNITYIVSCNYNTLVKIIFHAIQSFFFSSVLFPGSCFCSAKTSGSFIPPGSILKKVRLLCTSVSSQK